MSDSLSEYLSHRPNIERYMNYMNSSLGDKLVHILPHIERGDLQNPQILSIGSGTGVLENAIANIVPGSTVYALDASLPMLEAIHPHHETPEIEKMGVVEPIQAEAEHIPLKDESLDAVILSSLIHEVASYKHDFVFGEDMKPFFTEIFRVLKKGGRIIIRDFMQPDDPKQEMVLRVGEAKEDEMDPREFLERFANEFKGDDLEDLKAQIEGLKNSGNWVPGAKLRVTADKVFELAAHYSWSKSFNEEVKEKYGYYPIDQYVSFIQNSGSEAAAQSKVIKSLTYMQEGYRERIAGRLDLEDDMGNPKPLPNFTGIVVIEK